MRVAVIGLGKLGSPMAAVFASKGHEVAGEDRSAEFVRQIEAGQAPIAEPGLQAMLDEHGRRITATTETAAACRDASIVFVIVPTNSLPEGDFSLECIEAAVPAIAAGLAGRRDFPVVAIVSTVSPGGMVRIRELLEQAGAGECSEDFGLCYNPEFIALGSVIRDMLTPDYVLIGESDRRAGDILEAFYATIHDRPCCRMGFYSAEACKIATNVGLDLKISYANTVAELCERLPGGDARAVLHAVGCDRRIGPAYLKPGTAYGGPCLPRDCRAFGHAARTAGGQAWLAEAADAVNDAQTGRVADLVMQCTESCETVGILGLSYKPGTEVCEESAGVALYHEMERRGYAVMASDPQARPKAVARQATLARCIEQCQTLVVMTPWPIYRELPSMLAECGRPRAVIDCWGIVPDDVPAGCGVFRLGVN